MSRIAILLLEDSAIDAELVRERLRKEGFDFSIERVDTRGAFEAAIAGRRFDLILADHSLPGFDGVAALDMAHRDRPETPFIFVSATLGEEVAIECLKRGATDYVLKQRLDRLGPAIRRALDEARERSQRLAAQRALAERSVQLQRLAEISARVNVAHDVDSVVRVVTEEARGLIGAHQAVTSLDAEDGGAGAVNLVALSGKYAAWRGRATAPDGPELRALIARQNRPVRMTRGEAELHPALRPFSVESAGHPPLRGWLAALLIGRGGKLQGLIQLSEKDEGEFTPDDEYLIAQLAQMAAGAIENARLYEELRANDRRKDEFLAMLGHELRNPIAAVYNALAVFKRSRDERHRQWASHIVERQCRQLARLVDDLLDVSRITSGKIRLQCEFLDVATVVEAAVESARPHIGERKHELEVSVDRGVFFAEADPTRLEQVFVNLLTNAAKYTEPGGLIKVSVSREGRNLVVRVKDTGIGIPPDQLSRMFELFAQGERSIARSEGGLGIGLTVVRTLVELHGGSVAADSAGLGSGTEFTVRVPAAEAPAAEPGTPAAVDGELPRGSRILVVDDNIDTARGLSWILELEGHDVRTAHDGRQALAVASDYTPEYILMDIGLPEMDGYEVVRRLRHNPCCMDSVVIAVSGYGQDEDRRRSREAGFDHHLVKPVDHDALMSLIARCRPGAAR